MQETDVSKDHQHQPCCRLLTIFLGVVLILSTLPGGAQTITEINPNQSTLWANDPNGASGGRVNHVGVAPRDKQIMFAASEWGGIFKSTDGGHTWKRMDGHYPTVTWDVKVSPVDSNRVVATSFYDGRVNSLAGINVSTDGGATWAHPSTATPPANFCTSAVARDEPAAYGISFDPDAPKNIYVGTNCGLAISTDFGTTWHYVDVTPADKADSVWSVFVHHKGIIDTCGDDGHRRSTDGGSRWTSTIDGGMPLPAGICSIAASPDESSVLFAVSGTTIFESDDGGGSWISTAYSNPAPQGRIPFVKTNARAPGKYDLWFGDVSLYRRTCSTPSPAVPGKRCQASAWCGGFTSEHGAHDDMGDLAFDPSARALDACPILMSSDGGVFINKLTAAPECQNPAWTQPNVTPHGLWVFGMNEAHSASGLGELLYFGNQDDGTFAASNAETNSPTWSNIDCCDSFDVATDIDHVLYTVCCWDGERFNRLFLRNAGMSGGAEINTYPAGELPGWSPPDVVDRFGSNEYVLLTSAGVFITTNITANPISWTQLGENSSPAGACAVHAALSNSTPSFFVVAGTCISSEPDQIWRYDGTLPNGQWHLVNPPTGFEGFGVFTVDKKNSDRLFASVLSTSSVQMVLSTDGAKSWGKLSSLDDLMQGHGIFRYRNLTGPGQVPNGATMQFKGYVQPTLVAFSPYSIKTLLAAGADSGVFLSNDAGATWKIVTDNSGTAGNPHVPRARFASFDQNGRTETIFIGTQGRGVWKLEVCCNTNGN
jgi:photosystem II stability/assembly factor-like uncharacterized protein